MTEHEKQVEHIVNCLQCSIEEAQEIVAYDKEVDKMGVRECESDLTQEQKAYSKKHRQGDRKQPMVLNLTKRERKSDDTKGGLIQLLAETLQNQEVCESLEITNKERQIDFVWGGRKLRIVLSAPRK